MEMIIHQFLEFCLCIEAPVISSLICFSSVTVRFWLVVAVWIVSFSFSFDLKYFCSDIFSPTLYPRLHCFYHYLCKDNSKQFLLKIMLFPSHSLSTIRVINYKPVDMYLFKSTNRNTKTSCEICSKLAKGTSERSWWNTSMCLLLRLDIFQTCPIVGFE